MRIGIIAMARSGGKNLGDWISQETGYPYIHEPVLNKIVIDDRRNLIVKMVLGEWQELKEKPHMDKWIGLVRTDHSECAKSLLEAIKTNSWHNPYTLDSKGTNENDIELEQTIKWLDIEQNIILNTIPQIELMITYEGVYYSGDDVIPILKYLDIKNPKFLNMLDSSNRLRNKIINNTIL